jgi:hypothetical protein
VRVFVATKRSSISCNGVYTAEVHPNNQCPSNNKGKNMKTRILIGTIALVAGSLLAADPKDDVAAAASKLADAGNYSWKAIMDLGPNSQFTPGPTEGKVDKDGYTWLSVTFNDNTTEAVKKGDKVAVKGEDGWQAAAETGDAGGGGGGFNAVRMMSRRMQNLKPPAAEVQDLITKVKAITKDGDAYSGELTEEGAKALATMGFGRRGGGGNRPAPTNLKGSVKFWIKDGALTKYQSKVSGKRQNRDGDEEAFERTTTVEISDVGATKVTLPDDAKKKLT